MASASPDRQSSVPLFGAGTNEIGVYGLFDPTTLLVRYSRDIAEILRPDERGPAFHLAPIGDPRLAAYAATLHETVHWWQSIAYSTGFLLAMVPPTQSIAAMSDLKPLLPVAKIAKPFVRWVEGTTNGLGEHVQRWANNALNNWVDVEYGAEIIMAPTEMSRIVLSPLFESLGHSIALLRRKVRSVVSVSLEGGADVHIDEALHDHAVFGSLAEARSPGFYYGEPSLRIPLLGYRDIAETQARIAELQLLSLVRGGTPTLNEFEGEGLLGPAYSSAMNQFLVEAGLERPEDLLSPEVLLLLLACELALNAHMGYATPITHHERLITDLHPGWRLIAIARVVRRCSRELMELVRSADRAAHIATSTALCRELGWPTPRETMSEILSYCSKRTFGDAAVADAEQGRIGGVNGQIRFLYGLHISAVRDRYQFPEFFCWPSVQIYFPEPRAKVARAQEIARLLGKHSPPFVHGTLCPESGDGGSVTYSGMSGLPRDVGERLVANYFYAHIGYDLIRQLMCKDGDFSFDYRWLDAGKSIDFFRGVGERAFSEALGIPLSEIMVL